MLLTNEPEANISCCIIVVSICLNWNLTRCHQLLFLLLFLLLLLLIIIIVKFFLLLLLSSSEVSSPKDCQINESPKTVWYVNTKSENRVVN